MVDKAKKQIPLKKIDQSSKSVHESIKVNQQNRPLIKVEKQVRLQRIKLLSRQIHEVASSKVSRFA